MSVVSRIDDGDEILLQVGEVTRTADIGQGLVTFKEMLQCNRVGDLPAFDQLAAGCEDSGMTFVGEVFRQKEIRDLLKGTVVGQDRAEERLLRLVVDRRLAQIAVVGIAPGKRSEIGGCVAFHRDADTNKNDHPKLSP